jgi:hypothetical protein
VLPWATHQQARGLKEGSITEIHLPKEWTTMWALSAHTVSLSQNAWINSQILLYRPKKKEDRMRLGTNWLGIGTRRIKNRLCFLTGVLTVHCLVSRLYPICWNWFPSSWWSNIYQQIFRTRDLCFTLNLHSRLSYKFSSQKAKLFIQHLIHQQKKNYMVIDSWNKIKIFLDVKW